MAIAGYNLMKVHEDPMIKLWSKILKPCGSQYEAYIANRIAERARTNLITSTNWDGSPMTTNKKTGKPLIDTGYMLSAITTVGNKAVSPAPYSREVQEKTGNTFIQKPTPKDVRGWTIDYAFGKRK